MSLYGYGYEGMGYRYPRRPRKAYIGEKQAQTWTKAAVFNTAISRSNPWVDFLRNNNYYDEIKDVFRRAREAYYQKYPLNDLPVVERKLDLLKKQLDTLKEEGDVIERNAPGLADIYATTKVAKRVSYGDAVEETKARLRNEIDRINSRIAELEAVKQQLLATAKK
jgi:CRISPR/Cas system CSM-associated protein Csm3 (group 7 of RAMP superfamily)